MEARLVRTEESVIRNDPEITLFISILNKVSFGKKNVQG